MADTSQQQLQKIYSEIMDDMEFNGDIVKYCGTKNDKEQIVIRLMNLNFLVFSGGFGEWYIKGFEKMFQETVGNLRTLAEKGMEEELKKIRVIVKEAHDTLIKRPKNKESEEYDNWTDEMMAIDDKYYDVMIEKEDAFHDLLLNYYNG